MMKKRNFNRIKLALVEKEKSNKWLASKLNVNEATVSKWCTNTVQPSVESFYKIAEILDVEVRKLFVPTKEKDE
ncbi:MAG: helix-turn-helix transcriptional regulator [Bacteroidia bacterium]|nr:helix-turn-helix transcriptional regulator [Bacteroidia bacterium]